MKQVMPLTYVYTHTKSTL
uniref:Uncharacterized protein n=1 Tax=Anguilla anguilla TaxID=7936 RepID=A0A0E9PR59_ANGAN